jgi:beta-glucanase (GH16 family)
MRILKAFIFSLFALVLFGCSTSSLYVRKATWKDEFRSKGAPNSQMWSRSVTKPGVQLSAYSDDDRNAYVKNGTLHLRVYKTDDLEMPYKAGRVIACKEFHFKKGKLVVRAKAPTTPGLWPAIWLNGPKTKEGYFAELDLMEHVHAMGDSSYTAVYHLWGDFRGKRGNHVSYGNPVPINVGEWHIYALEILDDVMRMSVDGKEVYVIQKGDYGEEWPEEQEYSLRLAMAYGGYGAEKDGIDDSALPAEMLVDYVRFYELKEKK